MRRKNKEKKQIKRKKVIKFLSFSGLMWAKCCKELEKSEQQLFLVA